jgi:hypothetical protein
MWGTQTSGGVHGVLGVHGIIHSFSPQFRNGEVEFDGFTCRERTVLLKKKKITIVEADLD